MKLICEENQNLISKLNLMENEIITHFKENEIINLI